MDGAPCHRAFLALISVETSRLLRTSEDVAITRQLLTVPTHGLLVSSTFLTTTTAMCWLTDPTPADVVQSVAESGLFCRRSTSAVDVGWLAVVSRVASSCFDVNHTGMEGVTTLMKGSLSPICAVGRFVSAADAYCWMRSPATVEWLQNLVDSVGVDAADPVPRPRVSPPPCELPSVSGAKCDRSVSAVSQWPARGGSVCDSGWPSPSPGAARSPRGPGLRRPHGGDASHCAPGRSPVQMDAGILNAPGDGVARSPFAVWSAHAAAASLACACSTPRSKRRCACGSGAAKKMRLAEKGGVPAAINPAGSGHDDRTSPVFS